MGSQLLETTLFFAAMLAVFWLLRELVGVALGETTRPAMIRTMSAMLVVVGLMTAMQQAVRPTRESSTPRATTGNQPRRSRHQQLEMRDEEPRITRRTRMWRKETDGGTKEAPVDTYFL